MDVQELVLQRAGEIGGQGRGGKGKTITRNGRSVTKKKRSQGAILRSLYNNKDYYIYYIYRQKIKRLWEAKR